MRLHKCQVKAGNAQLQGAKESSGKQVASGDLDVMCHIRGTHQLMSAYLCPGRI